MWQELLRSWGVEWGVERRKSPFFRVIWGLVASSRPSFLAPRVPKVLNRVWARFPAACAHVGSTGTQPLYDLDVEKLRLCCALLSPPPLCTGTIMNRAIFLCDYHDQNTLDETRKLAALHSSSKVRVSAHETLVAFGAFEHHPTPEKDGAARPHSRW